MIYFVGARNNMDKEHRVELDIWTCIPGFDSRRIAVYNAAPVYAQTPVSACLELRLAASQAQQVSKAALQRAQLATTVPKLK